MIVGDVDGRAAGTSAAPIDCDFGRVPTERGNVFTHPLHGEALVLQAVVARAARRVSCPAAAATPRAHANAHAHAHTRARTRAVLLF